MMVKAVERLEKASAENGWINTVDTDKPEVLDKARQIIESNIYCSLSTCSVDGIPWASPVFFIYDEQWNIYWSSAVNSQHSQNIYTNHGRVAIAIYGSTLPMGTGQGLYFTGTATELDSSKIEWAIHGTSVALPTSGSKLYKKLQILIGWVTARIKTYRFIVKSLAVPNPPYAI